MGNRQVKFLLTIWSNLRELLPNIQTPLLPTVHGIQVLLMKKLHWERGESSFGLKKGKRAFNLNTTQASIIKTYFILLHCCVETRMLNISAQSCLERKIAKKFAYEAIRHQIFQDLLLILAYASWSLEHGCEICSKDC